MKRAAPGAAGKPRPATVDEYLAGVPARQRAALERLRKDIASAAPGAQECVAYGIAAFRQDGTLLVAFAAAARHCAFYPGRYPLTALAREVRRYDTSGGTIRFSPDEPLPAGLVRKLVRARIAERVPPRDRKGRKRG